MAQGKPGVNGRGPPLTVAMSSALNEIYRKEEKIRRAHVEKKLDGLLAENPEFLDEPPKLTKTAKDLTMERLETLRQQRKQIERDRLNMTTEERVNLTAAELSKSMWMGCNPGVTLDNTHRIRSTSSIDYEWRADEIEPIDKSNNRRRDEIVDFMEAMVKFKGMLKGGGAAGAPGKLA